MRTHRKKKKLYFDEILKEIQEHNSKNETRKFYKLINGTRKDFKQTRYACRGLNGELINYKIPILERWKQRTNK
jgi:hypothetical protein